MEVSRQDMIQALREAEYKRIQQAVAEGDTEDSFDLAGAVEYWSKLSDHLLRMEYNAFK